MNPFTIILLVVTGIIIFFVAKTLFSVTFVFFAGVIAALIYGNMWLEKQPKESISAGVKRAIRILVIASLVLFMIQINFPWITRAISERQTLISFKVADSISPNYPLGLSKDIYDVEMEGVRAEIKRQREILHKIYLKDKKGEKRTTEDFVAIKTAKDTLVVLQAKMDHIRLVAQENKSSPENKKKSDGFVPRFSLPQNFSWLQLIGYLIGAGVLIGLILLIFKATKPAGGKILAGAFAALAIIAVLGVIHQLFVKDRAPASPASATIGQPVDWSKAEEIKSAFVLKAGKKPDFKIPYDEYDKFEFIQCGRMGVYSVFDAEGKEHLISDQVKYLKADPGEKGVLTLKGGPKDIVLKISKLEVN